MKPPKVAVSHKLFRGCGEWWWATVKLPGVRLSSGYCRSKEVATRKLYRKAGKLFSALVDTNYSVKP